MSTRRRHTLSSSEPVFIPLVETPDSASVTQETEAPSGLTWYLILAVFSVTFGTWFPMGYSIAAMNGPQSVILNWIRGVKCHRLADAPDDHLTNSSAQWCAAVSEDDQMHLLRNYPDLRLIWALASSAFMLGGLSSTFTSAFLIDRFGLKKTILLNSAVFIVGNCLICLSVNVAAYELITLGRFVVGFSLGISCVAPPIYCSEITPVRLRGRFGVVPVVMNVLGMICATVLGLPALLGHDNGWVALIAVGCFLSQAVLLLVFPLCPDSPRRLYQMTEDKETVHRVLHWLRRDSLLVRNELKELEAESQSRSTTESVGLMQLLGSKYHRSVLKICAGPMLAQQFSGFSCVSFYSTAIFTDVGLTRVTSIYASIGLWVVFLFFTLICMALIDSVGRRVLLLISYSGMIVALMGFVVTLSLPNSGEYEWIRLVSAACIPVYIAFYSLGSNSIPYILPSEMFGQEARAAALTWISAISWGAAVLTTLIFPLINALTKEYTFLFFVACVVAATGHSLFSLPETKGKTIEEVQLVLRKRLGYQQLVVV